MPRPILAQPSAGPRHTIAAIGDSITHNITLGVLPDEFWPTVLADALLADGYRVRARNYGVSGNTSTQMLARIGAVTRHETPRLFVIACCVNDPGNGITADTTKQNIRDMIAALGAEYAILASPQFLHWTTGGDGTDVGDGDPNDPANNTGQGATYNALAVAMHEVAAEYDDHVAFANVWRSMRDAIVVGGVAADAIHTSSNNQHLNAAGEALYAAGVRDCIDGWAALQTALRG